MLFLKQIQYNTQLQLGLQAATLSLTIWDWLKNKVGYTNKPPRGTKDRALNYRGKYDFLGSPRAADDYQIEPTCLGKKNCCRCGPKKFWDKRIRKCLWRYRG